MAKAQAVRERMCLDGKDPAHGGDAAKKRGATQRELQRLNLEWEANPTHSMTDEEYSIGVLPRIEHVPARKIVMVLGVSVGYASEIRKGLRVPHPRHWLSLCELVTEGNGDGES